MYLGSTENTSRELGDATEKGRDFPAGAVAGSPPANAGDMGSSPGLGRSDRKSTRLNSSH